MRTLKNSRPTAARVGAFATALLVAGGVSIAAAAPASATDGVTVDYVLPGDIAAYENASTNYGQWHEGATNDAEADPTFSFTKDGLQLVGKSQIIDGITALDDAGFRAAVAAGVSWTYTGDRANFQVVLYGPAGFTTLYPTPSTPQTAGTHTVSLTDVWTTSRAINGTPAYAALAAAPLGDLLAASGAYNVIAYGVQADADTSPVVSEIKWGNLVTKFSAVPGSDEELSEPIADKGALDITKDAHIAVDVEDAFQAQIADGTEFDAYMYSTPTYVGTFAVTGGVVTVNIPAATLAALGAGSHTLVLAAAGDPTQLVTFSVTIAASAGAATVTGAAALASTGPETALPLALGGILLALGAGALVLRRKLVA